MRVFISGLNPGGSVDELLREFQDVGRVKNVSLPEARACGEHKFERGFLHVDVLGKDPKSIIQRIQQLNGTAWNGNTLRVEIAHPAYTAILAHEKRQDEQPAARLPGDCDTSQVINLRIPAGKLIEVHLDGCLGSRRVVFPTASTMSEPLPHNSTIYHLNNLWSEIYVKQNACHAAAVDAIERGAAVQGSAATAGRTSTLQWDTTELAGGVATVSMGAAGSMDLEDAVLAAGEDMLFADHEQTKTEAAPQGTKEISTHRPEHNPRHARLSGHPGQTPEELDEHDDHWAAILERLQDDGPEYQSSGSSTANDADVDDSEVVGKTSRRAEGPEEEQAVCSARQDDPGWLAALALAGGEVLPEARPSPEGSPAAGDMLANDPAIGTDRGLGPMRRSLASAPIAAAKSSGRKRPAPSRPEARMQQGVKDDGSVSRSTTSSASGSRSTSNGTSGSADNQLAAGMHALAAEIVQVRRSQKRARKQRWATTSAADSGPATAKAIGQHDVTAGPHEGSEMGDLVSADGATAASSDPPPSSPATTVAGVEDCLVGAHGNAALARPPSLQATPPPAADSAPAQQHVPSADQARGDRTCNSTVAATVAWTASQVVQRMQLQPPAGDEHERAGAAFFRNVDISVLESRLKAERPTMLAALRSKRKASVRRARTSLPR